MAQTPTSKQAKASNLLRFPTRATRYTYRYNRYETKYERHFDNEKAAVDAAVRDFHDYYAWPVAIAADGVVIYDADDLRGEWEKRYLYPTK